MPVSYRHNQGVSNPSFRRRAWWITPLAGLSIPVHAQAHMTVQGMSSFMTGALHPLMTPSHVIVLLALGLAVGQHVPLRLGMPLKVSAGFSAIGLALTTTGRIAGVHPGCLAGIAFLSGAVVALGKKLPSVVPAILLGAGALAIGLDSGVEKGSGWTMFGTLSGTWVGLLVYLVNFAFYTSLAAEKREQWLQIGIRVAGSWILAISVLMLAFALRR
jgi:hydrogenase/urease accessory protein HupE